MAAFPEKDLEEITTRTLEHYERRAREFWEGTRGHDVTQNYAALLEAIAGNADATAPYKILDLGCGPGRDLAHFQSLGHTAIGVDGSSAFVEMARTYSGCEVWHQDFLSLSLPSEFFDGVFANASLFHVPRAEATRVLSDLRNALKGGGVLFSSNPRGSDEEGWNGGRYGTYHSLETWRSLVCDAGFVLERHYYRPEGKPLSEQPWLATVMRKSS